MAKAFVLGSTGLVGKEILKALELLLDVSQVFTLGRRKPDLDSEKIVPIVNADTLQWPAEIAKNPASIFLSSFGTTRAAAGSAQKFIDIDYGINYDAAKLAKAAGALTYVLVSALGASALSMLLYPRTKGKLENDIIDLGFEHVIILRPGVLLGERQDRSGFGDGIASSLGRLVHGTKLSFLGYPCHDYDVAKVAVAAALEAPLSGKAVRFVDATELNLWAQRLSAAK